MTLTGDGKRVAFLAGSAKGERVVSLGDRVLEEAGWVVEWPLAMTEDAGVIACQLTETTTARACIGVNGLRGETFDAVGSPRLSADGKTVAYRARNGDRHFVVVGAQAGPAYDFVKDPALCAS